MIYNDQNPHVFNAYIYANSSDGYVYEQSTFALVHRSANWLAFGSGFVFSILSVYMILFRTPEHFRQFSRVLLLCAYSDVLYLFWCFCGQPVDYFEIDFLKRKPNYFLQAGALDRGFADCCNF